MERYAKAKFVAARLSAFSGQIGILYLLRGPGIVYLGDYFPQELERSGACRNN
jgi:hypothetical protein